MNIKTILVPAIVSAAVSIGGFYGNSRIFSINDDVRENRRRILVLEYVVEKSRRDCGAMNCAAADNIIDVWREIIHHHPSVTNENEQCWINMLNARSKK